MAIQFKRGAAAGLPTGAAGEPLFTTDTYKLYIGDGSSNHLIGSADFTLTTNGDILFYNSGLQRLAKGSDGQVLTLASGLPSWADAGTSGGTAFSFFMG